MDIEYTHCNNVGSDIVKYSIKKETWQMSVYTQSGMCTHANDSPENNFSILKHTKKVYILNYMYWLDWLEMGRNKRKIGEGHGMKSK